MAKLGLFRDEGDKHRRKEKSKVTNMSANATTINYVLIKL